MTPLINLPDASSTLGQVAAYSSPMFSDLLPLGLLFVGLLIGGMIVSGVIGGIMHAVGSATEGFFTPHSRSSMDYYNKHGKWPV